MCLVVLEDELLANLEDAYPPVGSVTPSNQPTGAAAPPLARSVSRTQSARSSATATSDRQGLEGVLKASSVGVTTQPSHTALGAETASTSEVSYPLIFVLRFRHWDAHIVAQTIIHFIIIENDVLFSQ